jgi:hypothetical protein
MLFITPPPFKKRTPFPGPISQPTMMQAPIENRVKS